MPRRIRSLISSWFCWPPKLPPPYSPTGPAWSHLLSRHEDNNRSRGMQCTSKSNYFEVTLQTLKRAQLHPLPTASAPLPSSSSAALSAPSSSAPPASTNVMILGWKKYSNPDGVDTVVALGSLPSSGGSLQLLIISQFHLKVETDCLFGVFLWLK